MFIFQIYQALATALSLNIKFQFASDSTNIRLILPWQFHYPAQQPANVTQQ